ncbi:TonB C-terminal domain-containing protein [Methylococcus sp. EFPC2]|uniref:TonB C-terminal domain-containing protein n=1 Tax=Methylococcus sp. EFPC2 TaxID=2812648 RepID=UPI001967EECC|nr:TonB C-terminal domain-containing protein [Methylococcus sp. EFPC2]QSA97273.1 TonB C-terminal domain-containing protein [Methylococcus sp. EFPC2]
MTPKHRLLRHLPVAIGVVLILLVALAVWYFRDLFEKPAQTKKTVQQITVIQPPPPPPPPPEQPPPPPEVKEEKIEEPEPEPEPEPEQPAEAPPAEDLGVDAEGTAGADGFGLVGKKGGRGLIGGGGGNAIIWYGQQVQKEVSTSLQQRLDPEVRRKKFTALVNIWIGSDGSISRAELAGSSGETKTDEALREALGGLRARINQPPPPSMPQPVKIRIRT